MKAIVQTGFGAPEDVLHFRDVPEPEVEEDEVLVRVRACGVAIGDWLITRGLPYIARPSYGIVKPKQEVAGLEFSGEIERVGAGVTDLAVGGEVFGWGNGCLAEYAAIPARTLAPKPADVTWEQAAAVPVSAHAALKALRAGGLQAGQRVLVIGASGAVGTFAVQIAKAMDAEVTAVCGTRNLELVRSLGADRLIDYTKDHVGVAGRHHLTLDIAGNRPLGELRKSLTPDGTLVIVGGSGGPWMMGFGRTLRAMALSPFVRQDLRSVFSSPNGDDLAHLRDLLEAGALTPIVDRTYPLDSAREAIEHVGERHGSGKTVVTV